MKKIEHLLSWMFSGVFMMLLLTSLALGQSENAMQPTLSEVTLDVTGMT